MRARGFTLVEMLTALAIFAVIGLMAGQIIASMVDVAEHTQGRAEELAGVQRAVYIVGRDIEQMARRSIRGNTGNTIDPVLIGGTGLLLELTRRGWQNPLDAPRSEVQRVGYALYRDQLVRLYWPVLDRAPTTAPLAQVLLDGVTDVDFVAHDVLEEEHTFWPRTRGRTAKQSPAVLAGIEMRLEHELYGRIERLWLVAPPSGFLQNRSRSAPDARPGDGTPEDRRRDEDEDEEPRDDEYDDLDDDYDDLDDDYDDLDDDYDDLDDGDIDDLDGETP